VAAYNLMYFIGALLCLREIPGAIGPRNAVRTPVEKGAALPLSMRAVLILAFSGLAFASRIEAQDSAQLQIGDGQIEVAFSSSTRGNHTFGAGPRFSSMISVHRARGS
jgi:hypothetical protein